MGVGFTGLVQRIGGAGSDEDLYGKKVEVPDYPTLDKAQRDAVAANKAIIPDATEVGARVNEFNQEQLEKMLREAIPELSNINALAGKNITSMLRGELPPDVANLIERKSAERAVSGGFAGSGVHRNLSARDLGLTSLDLTQKGLSSAERWIAGARQNQVAPLYDVTSMFVSPELQFAAAEGKFQRDLYAETMKAAPDPAKRGAWHTQLGFMGQVLGMFGGGTFGGFEGQSGGGGNGGWWGIRGGGNSNAYAQDTMAAAQQSNYLGAVKQAEGRLY